MNGKRQITYTNQRWIHLWNPIWVQGNSAICSIQVIQPTKKAKLDLRPVISHRATVQPALGRTIEFTRPKGSDGLNVSPPHFQWTIAWFIHGNNRPQPATPICDNKRRENRSTGSEKKLEAEKTFVYPNSPNCFWLEKIQWSTVSKFRSKLYAIRNVIGNLGLKNLTQPATATIHKHITTFILVTV